jgi:hypothetical protein
MTNMHETMYCPRDPEVETSLRCGRCGSLICPTCLVQSPVGSRCPSCAAIGRSPMQDTSRGQVVKAIIVGLVVAAIGGPALVGLLLVVDRFPRGSAFGALVGFVAIGYLAGEAVRRVVGYKLDKRFQYIAGLSVFGAYLVATFVVLASPNLRNDVFSNIVALAGMGIGIWVAMGRVRP